VPLCAVWARRRVCLCGVVCVWGVCVRERVLVCACVPCECARVHLCQATTASTG
jgi:hypothetical protein